MPCLPILRRLAAKSHWKGNGIWISLLGAFHLGDILTSYSIGNNSHPPSNVATIDPSRLHLSEELANDNLCVKTNAASSVTVTQVAARYGFHPPLRHRRGFGSLRG